jgi:hypothetical protein
MGSRSGTSSGFFLRLASPFLLDIIMFGDFVWSTFRQLDLKQRGEATYPDLDAGQAHRSGTKREGVAAYRRLDTVGRGVACASSARTSEPRHGLA